MTKTKATKQKEIERQWHLIDADGQVLGRMATKIAMMLMGKNKPNFAPYLDGGDFVVVVNASKVRVTGNKESQKLYYRHSGFPGGFKEIDYASQMEKDPRKIIHHAVKGMLPKNKHRDPRLSRLKIYPDLHHPHQGQFKKD